MNFAMKKHIAFAHPQTLAEAIAHGIEFEAVDGSRNRKPETSERVAVVSQPISEESLTLETISQLIDQRLEKFMKGTQKSKKFSSIIKYTTQSPMINREQDKILNMVMSTPLSSITCLTYLPSGDHVLSNTFGGICIADEELSLPIT